MRNDQKSILDIPHLQVTALSPLWDMWSKSYHGGSAYTDMLHSHRLESDTDFKNRYARSVYENRCKKPVNRRVGFLYSKKVFIDPEPPQDFSGNADQKGNSLIEFLKMATLYSLIYGFSCIGIDRPRIESENMTRRNEQELGIRTYLNLIMPTDLWNWSANEKGVFDWVVLNEANEDRSLQTNDKGLPSIMAAGPPRKRLWTPEGWFLYQRKDKGNKDWQLIDEGKNPTGVVPIVAIRAINNPEDPIVGTSLLEDIAPLNKDLYNLASLKAEILYRQTFPQLVLQGAQENYMDEDGNITFSTSMAFIYPEGVNAPLFIQPEHSASTTLSESIATIRAEIAEIGGEDPNAMSDKAAESGEAKKRRFASTNAELSNNGNTLAGCFERVLNIVSKWNQESTVYKVQFPEHYDLESASEVATQAMADMGILANSQTGKEWVVNDYVNARYPNMPQDIRNKISDEVSKPVEMVHGSFNDGFGGFE